MSKSIKSFILCVLVIAMSINSLISQNVDFVDYHPGMITVCFSADMVGNSRGDFSITIEDGIVQTPFVWFNELAEDFQIVNLTQKYPVKNHEWHLNGQYPSNVFRLEIADHSRTNELVEAFMTRQSDILFAELEAVYRFDTVERINAFPTSLQSKQSEEADYSQQGYIPNDQYINLQYALQKVQAFEAWEIHKGDPSIAIGVVDSGLKWNHPDIADNTWRNEPELPGMTINFDTGIITGGDGIDNDGNGFIDDVMGWDFAPPTNGGPPPNNPFQNLQGHYHGTHVAGIAAAVGDNEIGIAGLAYNASLVATKNTPYNQYSSSVVNGFAAIYYLVDTGIRVVNCSWSAGTTAVETNLVSNYARDHGTLIIASAGNNNVSTIVYPGGGQHVIAVASTDENDIKSGFSNYGNWVDVSAPGSAILSTFFTPSGTNSYETIGGTSMSTPLVAGLAGLLLSRNPGLTVDELRAIILEGVDPIDHLNPAHIGLLGSGRVNALTAMILAQPFDFDLGALSISGPAYINENETVEFSLNIRNNGLNQASGYTVNLMAEGNDTPLVSLPGVTIEQYMTHRYEFVWTPPNVGYYNLYGQILWNQDEKPENNITVSQNFNVLPLDMTEISVGDPNSTINRNEAFINYNYHDSITQTIYLEEELEKGTIYQISVRFSGHGDIPATSNIKLYMATTEKRAFNHNSDWIPYSEFIEVYNGGLAVTTSGVYNVTIILQKPFVYTGDNLVVLAYKDLSDWYNENNAFQYTQIPSQNRTMYWRSDTSNPNTNPLPTANGRLDGITNMKFFMTFDNVHYPPHNLQADTSIPGRVVLTWEEPELQNDDLIGYIVYRDELLLTETPFYEHIYTDDNVPGGTYIYGVIAVYTKGQSEPATIEVEITGSEGGYTPQIVTRLNGNFPNPFNPETTISFDLAVESIVLIDIYNIRGQKIRTLLNSMLDMGEHTVIWNGKDDNGRDVSSGLYFYRMMTDDYTAMKRMILMK